MVEKKNILFLVTKSEVGGAQKYIKEQIDICEDQYNIYLATDKEGWLTESTASKVKATFLDGRIQSRMSPGYLINLIKFIRQHNIDLVIGNSANGGLYGRIAAKVEGVSSVYVSHGWSSVYNGGRLKFLLNRIERYLARISDKVICVSENDYKVAMQVIGIPDKKLALIRNSIFPIESPNVLKEFASNDRFKLVSVARIAYPKRMELLSAAMKEIDFADLYLVGTGPEEQILKAYIEENNLKNVFMLGEIKSFDKFTDYNAFILISDSEGLPMSALEAMSTGIPLILSNVGGCKEIVVNEELLVENSTEDIIRAIHVLKGNYNNFKAPVKSFFDANFNLVNSQNKYLSLYRSLIK